MFGACSELWAKQNPLPDLAAWAAVADPDERLSVALDELYAFYARNEQMLANLYRDARADAGRSPSASRRSPASWTRPRDVADGAARAARRGAQAHARGDRPRAGLQHLALARARAGARAPRSPPA